MFEAIHLKRRAWAALFGLLALGAAGAAPAASADDEVSPDEGARAADADATAAPRGFSDPFSDPFEAPTAEPSGDAEAGLAAGLDEKELLFGEIPSVYGASKHEQRVTDAPAAVSVITAAEIRAYGYRSMSEILRSLRGFYITDDRTYQHMGVRGFGQPGDWNSRVLILVDGDRISDNIYDLSPVGHDFPLDLELIERIEIIRGPASSLYGGNALFGVINVVTRRGRDLKGFEVAAGGSSSASAGGRVTWGDRLPAGPELVVSVSGNQLLGGPVYLPELEGPGVPGGVVDGLDWKHSYQGFVTASYRSLTFQAIHSDAATGLATGIWGIEPGVPGGLSRDITTRAGLSWHRAIRGGWMLDLQSQYQRYQLQGAYPYLWEEEGEPAEVYLNHDRAIGDALRSEILTHGPLTPWASLTVGVQQQLNLRLLQQNYELEDEERIYYTDSSERGQQVGAFAQGELKLGPQVILNAGLRYDWFSTFGRAVSPRAALIWSATPTTTIKALYGQAYRPPNAYELYYGDNETLAPNPALLPEGIRSVELAVEQRISDRLRLTAAGYTYWLSGLICQVSDGEWLRYENMDQAEARGGELEIEGRLPAGLTGRASYSFSYVRGGVDGEERLANSPQHLGNLNLQRQLFKERLGASLEAQLMSARLGWDGSPVPGHVVVNATALAAHLAPGLSASVSVYNVLNRRYLEPVSEEHPMVTIAQDGISLRGRLTYTF